MNRKQRTILVMVVFWGVILGVPGVWLFRAERLNRGLTAAINRDDTPAALFALQQGADPNTPIKLNMSPWESVWSRLWFRGQSVQTAYTPLFSTISFRPKDNPDLALALLNHGGRIALDSQTKFTPLFFALSMCKPLTSQMLINYDPKTAVNPTNHLLTCAIAHGNKLPVIETMLRRGADPNQADDDEITPLGYAVNRGDVAPVRCLLQFHADSQKQTKGLPGSIRPLEYAEKHHMTEIAKLLREAGAKR